MPDQNWRQQQAAKVGREAVYAAIADHLDAHGVSPEVPDVVKMTGLSLATVKRHIAHLIAEGRLRRGPGRHGNLHIT